MTTAVRNPVRPLLGVLAWVMVAASPALAQDDGMFVTVQNPITTDVVNGIRTRISARQADPTRKLTHVVFDFNPDGKPAATTDFGAALSLQEYILRDVTPNVLSVAFVHAETTAHTVLPVLACDEIVMSKAASVGRIAGDGVPAFGANDSRYTIYEETLERVSRKGLKAVVRKMCNADVRLRKGRDRNPPNDPVFVDLNAPDVEKLVAGDLQKLPQVTGAQDGQLGFFSTTAAREIGLCKATAETRQDVIDLYGLPPTTGRDDPLGGRAPDVFQWVLDKKDIDNSTRETVGRVIRDVRKKGGNVLILVINVGGNDLSAARDLAGDLVSAQSGAEAIKIVAFIPEKAPAAGTVLALGCSEIVMARSKPDANGEVKEAEIGDFEGYLKTAQPADAAAQLASIRKLAQEQGYPALLVDGMFNPDVEILRVLPTDDTRANQRRFMTREDYEKDKAAWREDKTVKPKGKLLKLSAALAVEYGFARSTVEGTDTKTVTSSFGWPDAKSPDPGWLDRFADFLRIPAVTVLLVVIGFTGLILELKVPGLTVPGIVAALCFILVFWAHSKFSGQTFMLALLLFLLGLVLVGIEIFVLPGFGACGIMGIVCMLAGLGLVTLERIPQTGGEWGQLGVKVTQYMVALLGSIALAVFIAKFLPKMPGANRLVLTAPAETDVPADNLPGAGEAAELLGAMGTTNTPLRPAGVVKFGDKFVDVVSDGGFIPAGTRVQVILVEATRIVVKEV